MVDEELQRLTGEMDALINAYVNDFDAGWVLSSDDTAKMAAAMEYLLKRITIIESKIRE